MKILIGSLKHTCIMLLCILFLILCVIIAFLPAVIACIIESYGASNGWITFFALLNIPWAGMFSYIMEDW